MSVSEDAAFTRAFPPVTGLGLIRDLDVETRIRGRHLIPLALLAAVLAPAQQLRTLEEVTSRTGADFIAAYEGRSVTVRAQIAADPIAAVGTYYLPVRDGTEHGLILRGDLERFTGLEPGDWIEAAGSIQSRGGMPLLEPLSILKLRHDSPPEPKELTVADLYGYRYLGLLVRTEATAITGVNENLGGTSIEIGDSGSSVVVFLPRGPSASRQALARLRAGDRVRLRGLATQYSLEPPHDRAFQLILPSPEDLEVLETASTVPPFLLLGTLGFIALLLAVWWIRERRMGAQRRSMRVFHALSEEVISAASPSEIAEKLATELPTVTRVTAVRLYLFSRRTKSLERVPTSTDPEPIAVPLDAPPGGLASGAAACFRNRTMLNVPDVRRSPFVNVDTKTNLPRSAMFVPLLAQSDVLGVLEVSNSRRAGYFTLEEQATTQHLANQVAASLKLQQQQTMREQLFRGEKLAATGQLISGVATDLRAPLESIVQLATSLTLYAGRRAPESDLRQLAGEARRASEIVSRLVSFARPEDSGERHVDVTALVSSLMKFREPEWRTLGVRIQDRLAPEHAPVLGVQGQLEQVFLNLLVHAEQSAAEAPGKTIAVSSSVIASRVTVEIGYSVQSTEPPLDPFSQGLAVCQGIVQSHGGEIRFRVRSGTARFEVDLPVATAAEETHSDEAGKSEAGLTLMLVDSDTGGHRQLLGLLGSRGHRAVPTLPEEAVDLAQRLRFDAVVWAVRPSNSRWNEFHDRIRAHASAFVLLNDGYDPELARTLEENGGYLLSRPIQELDLDRVLRKIETQAALVKR